MTSVHTYLPTRDGAAESAVLDMRCGSSPPSSEFEWHEHPFLELAFVSQDQATIGFAPHIRSVEPDTLVLFHGGERHASWAPPRHKPRFWLLHFHLTTEVLSKFPRFIVTAPEQRVWKLQPRQGEAFRRLFLQMLNERVRPQELQAEAEAAWLHLLLISVHRWVSEGCTESAAPPLANPELVNLWHLVNASVGQSSDYVERIHRYPNYDSLRHSFKRAFGCSPRGMVMRLRVQHAKNLLLESNLSVKEIAVRCGYQRQHEFSRAFRQQVGFSPTEWRADPTEAIALPSEFVPAASSAPALRQTA
jgi:AraC-like DNA-binding protein